MTPPDTPAREIPGNPYDRLTPAMQAEVELFRQQARDTRHDAEAEADLQRQVIALAESHGWLVYHTHNSRGSQPGFPDLVMARGQRVIFAELKSNLGRVRPEQQQWLDTLLAAGQEAYLWRPRDWPTIQDELTRNDRPPPPEAL